VACGSLTYGGEGKRGQPIRLIYQHDEFDM
jgi:hypothetical protein